MRPSAPTWCGRVALALVMAMVLAPTATSRTAFAQAMGTREEATPRELRSVKIDERMDAQVPLDATFRDQDGRTVRLRDVIDGKRPTLLSFAYFRCPVLCSLLLDSAASSMARIPWTIGREFDVVTVSIDPEEAPERARTKRDSLLAQYGRPDAEHGWHFLLGDEAQIARVTDAVGYRFHYDEETGQFAHPAALVLLQPNGHVSRYLYGLEYPPSDIRLALLEASQGKLVSAVEQVMLFCYRYDAHQGRYVIVANRVMRLGAAAVALALGGFLGLLWRRERRPGRPGNPADTRRDGEVAPMETRT
jgi:protein SCO1/2